MERFLNPELPGYYYYYCASTRKKRKWKKTPLAVHICFLFSVQLIAAVCPFMSNHQCMYPHIPTAGSLSQRVAVCFGATSKACLSLPGTFSKFKLISRCALLYKKTHFLSFCHVLYLPVSDPSLALRLSFSVVIASLCPTPTTKKPLLSLWWRPVFLSTLSKPSRRFWCKFNPFQHKKKSRTGQNQSGSCSMTTTLPFDWRVLTSVICSVPDV